MAPKTDVYLERGGKRTFAGAVDWPGWCRAAKTDDEALESLVAYGPRYAEAMRGALAFTAPKEVAALEVVERLEGNATTDFGAPAIPPRSDDRPVNAAELKRLRTALTASWAAFDAAVRGARSAVLRKGPRGGGRDLAGIVSHVIEAEGAYLSKLGARHSSPAGDPAARIAALREAVLGALTARAQGEAPNAASGVRKLWSPRYFARRAAWHVLDHAWEIEDRAERRGP